MTCHDDAYVETCPARDDPVPDPYYEAQWYLEAIRAPEAWAAGYNGSGVQILINDEGVKKSRVGRLEKYLTDAVNTSIESWAMRVRLGAASVSDDVLTPALQAFLGARDIDAGRLESMRLSTSSSAGSDALCELQRQLSIDREIDEEITSGGA